MIELDRDYNFNIIIVGVGGTGSHLVSFLSHLIGGDEKLKIKHNIILVDGDNVETKNLRTQKFLLEDVGKYKAQVLADRYNSVFDLDINFVNSYIQDKKQLEDLFDTYYNKRNIVVSCVDNNKARIIFDNFFKREDVTNMIYIDTGNSSGPSELIGQTVVGYKKNGNTILPPVSTYFPKMLEEEEVSTLSCQEQMLLNIQNIGANITSASTVFNILNNIISFNRIPGNLFTFNATNIETNNLLKEQ
jgi:PRTRC genetic system ThiF family protein